MFLKARKVVAKGMLLCFPMFVVRIGTFVARSSTLAVRMSVFVVRIGMFVVHTSMLSMLVVHYYVCSKRV